MPHTAPRRADPLDDPREAARRAPVWTALSNLFVGSVLDEVDYRSIADALAASGYSLEELDRVLRDEVAPVFATNLSLSPTPEMLGWSDEGVRELVLAHLRRQRHPWRTWVPTGWLRDRQVALVADRWAEVRRRLAGGA